MKSLARIAIVAILGGLASASFWWAFGRFGNFFGIPGAAHVSPWLIGGAAALLAGCGEAWRTVVHQREVRLNREVADALGCVLTDSVSAAEIRSWPQLSLFRNDSPSGRQRMTGHHNGRQIDVFDFRYTVTNHSSSDTSSSSTSTFIQTVFRFPQAAQGWECFLVKPRHRMTGLFNRFMGITEVEVSSPDDANEDRKAAFAQFRRCYQITVPAGTGSHRELQQLFHPYVIAWLAFHPGWSMESNGRDFVAWKSDSRVVGTERLRMLQELDELLSLLSAAELASERAEPTRIDVRKHDRERGLSGFLGLWLGAMLGAAAGATLGGLIISVVFASPPETVPMSLVIGPLFYGSPIAFAVLGGYLGMRFGHRSEWCRRFAKRIDPRPNDDSGDPATMPDARAER